MMNPEEFVPNVRLRRARILKGWSQAELAEQVGTSFEMVSRWERGVTVPSPRYQKRLYAVLGKTAEELGLMRDLRDQFTPPPSPLVLLASSHADAEKGIVSHLKATLHGRGIALWNSRQFSRQGTENSRAVLHEVVRAAQVILVIVSPEARSSRHVREAFEMARIYRRPVCGFWIEGQHLEQCLPESRLELAALIDAREKDTPAMLEETANALEQVLFTSQESTQAAQLSLPDTSMEVVTPTNHPTEMLTSTNPSERAAELVPLQSKKIEVVPPSQHSLEPINGAKPLPADLPQSIPPNMYAHQGSLSRIRVGLLIGLAILVIAGGLMGSLSLLTHFRVLSVHSGSPTAQVVRGGTWTEDFAVDPYSLIPDTSYYPWAEMAQQALYLPLFYGDAHGVVHPGAATEIPTVQNGGVSADATTWTFHLRPHLVWSDGQPYDARDVAYTWKLMLAPTFYYGGPVPGLDPSTSVAVSTDHLSITFHLRQPYVPFLALWIDGYNAPLPAHHFSSMTPEAILKSADRLNPKVVSGPFMISESVPGDHYTLIRNPRYYLASEGLPYLDKVIIHIAPTTETILKDLQAGSIDSYDDINSQKVSTNPQAFQRFNHYTLVSSPTSAYFLGLFFNFANTVLATHVEVRTAIAIAIDHQALIATVVHGFAEPICTDHGSAYHPGYEPNYDCPPFDPAAANKLLDDNGWVKGPDGVRTKGKQRMEFELSSADNAPVRLANEVMVQHDLSVIGIKLDIQNYGAASFFGSFLPEGKASPPTGAVAGRNDIAEFAANPNTYDPDDSSLIPCDQYPRYCNPALDALYKQELETPDPGQRQQIFSQIHHIYLADFPFIPLYFPLDVAVVRKGMHNYQPSPFIGETVNIWEWWCDNGKC
jgi:peptide/nickel transport system substrate-binding protein